MRWSWASASEIGTSHLRLGTRKQDALSCFLAKGAEQLFCAVVCDGAGSATFGGEGAWVVCRVLTCSLRAHFRSTTDLPNDSVIWSWIDLARDSLALAAERRRVERRAFASTLVLLVAAKDQQLVVHVGDGAVVGRTVDGEWIALSWPENGEYASTTYFVTDDPMPRARILRSAWLMNGCAVFSDGIEELALNQVALLPHQPFFRAMLAPLEDLETTGKCVALSSALGDFLRGPRVCSKTDDDKSLVLASLR